jgi:hypothetical protein
VTGTALAGHDPRLRADGLGWVTRALFPGDDLRVTAGRAVPGSLMSWAIVPSVERARFLVPLGNRRVAAASVLAYNALRSGRTRTVRSVIGALARVGAAQALPFPVLSVIGSPADSVLGHLADVLGEPSLVAAIGVRPPDPTRKPTLQLFDDRGRPRGYAKIGWNEATRSLVRAESAALRAAPADPGGDYPVIPAPLHAGEWAGRVIGVTAPLPASVRRLPDPSRPRLEAMLAVARRGGGAGERRSLDGSPFLARLTEAAASAAGGSANSAAAGSAAAGSAAAGSAGAGSAGAGSAVAAAGSAGGVSSSDGAVIRAAVERLGSCVELEFGDWHGDWVPWNLGEVTSADGVTRLVAWDWEHRGTNVPVGFDLAHQAFNTALVVGGQPADRAAEAAREALRRHGPALRVPLAVVDVVVDAYLAEMWLRTSRMAAGGAGWNADLHPILLEVLATR